MPANRRAESRTRRGFVAGPTSPDPADSQVEPAAVDVSPPGRTANERFGLESEPAWLRKRRAASKTVPAEQWILSSVAESANPDAARRLALSASDAVLAALPLVVGFVLLLLGFGSGQITFQT